MAFSYQLSPLDVVGLDVFAITHRFGESGRVCSLQVRTLRSLAIGPDSGSPLSSLRGPCVPPRSERQATPRPAGPGSSMAARAAHWRDRSALMMMPADHRGPGVGTV